MAESHCLSSDLNCTAGLYLDTDVPFQRQAGTSAPQPALDALCRSLNNSKADTWQAHIRQACLEVVHSNKVYLIHSLQDASAWVNDERDICRDSSAAGRPAYLICGFQQQHSKLLIQKPPGHLHRLWRQKAGQV